MTPTPGSVAYRMTDVRQSLGTDEYDRSYGYQVVVLMYTYPIIRFTPKGYWIDLGFGHHRFVRDNARKKFATLTKAEARESFVARKQRQLRILNDRLADVQRAMEAFSQYQREHWRDL